MKGAGNEQNYGARISDPRVGRFLSVDPISKSYPWYTPYSFAGNSPIVNLDLDGEEEYHYTLTIDKQGSSHLKLNSVKFDNYHNFLGFKFKTKIQGERYIVNYGADTYSIGFAQAGGNSYKIPLFKQFLKHPDASILTENFDTDAESNGQAMITAWQTSAIMMFSMSGHFNAKPPIDEPENTKTIYRAQGGIMPNASQQRISVGTNGNIDIQGDDMLHVNIDDKAHAVYFYQKRGGSANGASIVSFEIPESLANEIKAKAVPQAQAGNYPGQPQIDDPTRSNSAYGLPKEYIQKLKAQAIPGSGKVITP